MNHLKISILVPVYGAEKYISRCARSLFGQTYANIEFVFVNDCTPDRSIEILKSVLEDYPQRQSQTKIINHDKNRGVAAARNTLLDNATGDYILWVDADDFIKKNTIELLIKKIIGNDVDIICFGTTVHSVYGDKPLPLFNGTSPKELIIDLLSGRIFTVLWGNMIKKTLFTDNNILFIEGLDIGEDMFVLIKLLFYSKKISVEKSILYYYDDTNDNSLVRSFSIEKNYMTLKILEKIDTFLKDKIDVSVYINERKLEVYLSIIYEACISGNKSIYNWVKSILEKTDWKYIKNRKSSFYLFFLSCDSYCINRMWAYIMFLLKRCVFIKKQIIKKLHHNI